MDGTNKEVKPLAAEYKLAFYNDKGKVFYLGGMWRKEQGKAVLGGKTKSKPFLEDAIKELVRIFRADESVAFQVFKADARKDGSRDSSKGRKDGPSGSGFADKKQAVEADDGLNMGDAPDSDVDGDIEPDSDLPF